MNIENLDVKWIEDFSLAYYCSKFKFGAKPEALNSKKQKKIRKWLYKNHIDFCNYPEDIVEQLHNMSDSDFMSFLKSCSQYIDLFGTEQEQAINKFCEDFPPSVKHAFKNLFDYEKSNFKRDSDSFEIVVEPATSYEEKLILSDVDISTDSEFETLIFSENSSFRKEGDTYTITGEAWLKDEGVPLEVSISFKSAKAEIQCFNSTNTFISDDTPWDQLLFTSLSIIAKENLENAFNTAETKLLPLLKEIKHLVIWDDDTASSLPSLKALITKYQYRELLPLIEKIESLTADSVKQNARLYKKLTKKLELIKYKPLWQEIYDLICESQKNYPELVTSKKPKGTITRLKNKVTGIMQEYGYSGEYPDFYKKDAVKGIHFFDSYNMSYTVAFHKNAVHHIHCQENLDDENGIYVSFLYGNEFLKRNEAMSDINSCRFNCKGRKHTSSVMFTADYEEGTKLPLEERINIVVKKAEFKKLTKQEKANILGGFNFKIFWSIAIFFGFSFGFLFATLFIPAMMAFCAFMLWVEGMPVIISDIPWLTMYFATWALSGISFGIITAVSKK